MGELPVAYVSDKENGDVLVKWGEGARQTRSRPADVYTDFAQAVDSEGVAPIRKTFGSLYGCHGGILTTIEDSGERTRYRIQAQQPDGKLPCCFCILVFKCLLFNTMECSSTVF
jgi:hypothetical protein